MVAAVLQRIRAFGLVARFTLVGAGVALLVASSLAWFIEARLTELMLAQTAARAIDQVQLGILDRVTAADFAPPFTPARLDELAARLDPALVGARQAGSGVIRLNLFARDGTILYSDLVAKRGQMEDPDDSERLAAALAGSISTEVSDLDGVENADLHARYGSALEVYVPFTLDGRVVGAYELYQDLAPIRPIRPLVWGTVLGGFLLLLLSVLVVVRGAALLIRRQQDTLLHQALHDPLTGLPNRTLFLDRLEHALDRAAQDRTLVAVLFLDLDDFKVVNDSLGHVAGDELLVAVAHCLQACTQPGEILARIGGDEFLLLLERCAGIHDATQRAGQILEQLRTPVQVRGREMVVRTSIGIAVGDTADQPPEELVRNADVAMYRAKRQGKGRYEIFDPGMNAQLLARLELESDLRQALARGQFCVYYQPIVQLGTGRIREVEALVRWQHPRRGLVAPAEFIPLAEETGLIVPLGRWVLEEACRQVRSWQATFGLPLILSANLSVRQVQQPALIEDIAGILHATGLDPRTLKLEITESLLLEDQEAVRTTLRALKGLGIQLALDDFGTGYSALGYLKCFPIDTLKIDRSFTAGLGRDPYDTAIVRAVVAFARALGLSVTAEGVETAEQLAELRRLGCDRGQGFYFDRPLPPDGISALLAQENGRWRDTARATAGRGLTGLPHGERLRTWVRQTAPSDA